MPTGPLTSLLRFPISELEFFSSFDRQFSRLDPSLDAILPHPPTKGAFDGLLREKISSYTHRGRLASILEQQYHGLDLPDALAKNIHDLAHGHAVSITTAHQPLLFGGTLYFLYKALSAIRLAREAESWLPDQRVVPVFVLGSEDHDYEEVRHIRLLGKTMSWESDAKGGPVGRMDAGNIPELIEQLKEIFTPLPFGNQVLHLLEESYKPGASYGQSTFRFLHHLLGRLGLVVIDLDHPLAKQACIQIFEQELTQGFAKPIIEQTIHRLEKVGFAQQAHVRDINLFYLDGHRRERIESDSPENYRTVDQQYAWTRTEILLELQEHPERFSPNVNLRPVLQETMLPNLAFVGGAGELAYWVQLTDLFQSLHLPFPILVRRHSGLLVDEWTQQKLTKLGLPLQAFFQPQEALLQQFVHEMANVPGDLDAEREALRELMKQVKAKCAAIEPTLERSAESAEVQMDKLLQALEGKMTRGLKQIHEREVNQIRGIYDRLMPEGQLQERNESFLSWMARYGYGWIDDLLEAFTPLDFAMVCYRF